MAIKPMLATLIQPRALASGWVYEPKLDGIRVLVKRTGRGIQMLSRLDNRIDATWPDVVAALASALRHDAIVDGELVAIDPVTRLSSFNRLQARIHVLRPSAALIARVPVELWLFDCLQVKGEDLRARPWRERRKRLEQLVRPNEVIRVTPVLAGTFRKLYGEACRSGSEGLIGKRTASRYTSGRSGDWVKLKCVNEQEFIVVGWTDPKGTRKELGALLLGYYDHDALRYAGKVGTGFDARALRLLKELLRPLGIRRSAVHDPLPVRTDDVHWVRPSLVVEIGFSEWTRDGRLRHPRYLGLREDKAASDVVREDPRAP